MNTTETPLPSLPYPVYFVIKAAERWREFMNDSLPPSADDLYEKMLDGNDTWSAQTYIQLRRRGLDVHLSDHYPKGQICVTSYDDLAIKDFPYNSYVVACRHDRARPEICEQRIVQNLLNVQDSTDHFVPYWPQPHLHPREAARGTNIQTLVYKGLDIYLAKPFRSPEFIQGLEKLGIQLEISHGNLQNRQIEWWDYRSADVVLAVRNCTAYDLTIKPANKLINAWRAGCPALLGPEPAYQALRKSTLDYFEVKSPAEALAALKKLKENPILYKAMVRNGLERAQAYEPDKVAECWREILAGPITDGYRRWQKSTSFARALRFFWRCFKHKRELRKFMIGIHNGPRLFPNE
jgi:hypothetical protein